MKQMQRDPLLRAKALRAERRADEKSGLVQVITLKKPDPAVGTAGAPGGGGFRKGGFRNAFVLANGDGDGDGDGGGKNGGEDGEGEGGAEEAKVAGGIGAGKVEVVKEVVEGLGESGGESESESEDEGEKYDPRRPTGCGAGCPGL